MGTHPPKGPFFKGFSGCVPVNEYYAPCLQRLANTVRNRFVGAASVDEASTGQHLSGRDAPGMGAYKASTTCIARLVADYGKTIIYPLARRTEFMI